MAPGLGIPSRAYPETAQQNQVARETHVSSQMGRQGTLIEALTKQLHSLEVRLKPVLRDVPPQPSNPDKEKMSLVGHAIALANQNDQLENLVQFVSEIYDRLEL
jgi:hypothetical protein